MRTGLSVAQTPGPVARSLVRLVAYYAIPVAGTLLFERAVPELRDAVAFHVPAGVTARELRRTLEAGGEAGAPAAPVPPAVTTALAMAGALALMIPVAWVYMLTKRRERWDPSVVQTVILLPLAIAGIVAVVRNSLALAFSLAGLAAAVRFRNTLKDTKDAVYIFLAIAVGLAAGVQALALGFVVSVIFNGAVLALWALNVGDIYAAEAGGRRAEGEERGGRVLVQADAAADRLVEAALAEHTKSWRLMQRAPGAGGRTLSTYVVRLKKKTTPAALCDAIAAGAAAHGATAEFQRLPS